MLNQAVMDAVGQILATHEEISEVEQWLEQILLLPVSEQANEIKERGSWLIRLAEMWYRDVEPALDYLRGMLLVIIEQYWDILKQNVPELEDYGRFNIWAKSITGTGRSKEYRAYMTATRNWLLNELNLGWIDKFIVENDEGDVYEGVEARARVPLHKVKRLSAEVLANIDADTEQSRAIVDALVDDNVSEQELNYIVHSTPARREVDAEYWVRFGSERRCVLYTDSHKLILYPPGDLGPRTVAEFYNLTDPFTREIINEMERKGIIVIE